MSVPNSSFLRRFSYLRPVYRNQQPSASVQSVTPKLSPKEPIGNIPLTIAEFFKGLQKNDKLKVVTMLKRGFNPNVVNFNGWSPVYFASYHGQVGILRSLFAYGAKPNLVLKEYSPLELAAGCGPFGLGDISKYNQCVSILLKNGYDPNYPCRNGSILGTAAHHGCLDMVMNLVRFGSKIDGFVSSDLSTPLMRAIKGKHDDVACFLLTSGANPNLTREKNFKSALGLAVYNKLPKCVPLLLENGAKPINFINDPKSYCFNSSIENGGIATLRSLLIPFVSQPNS